MPGAFSQSEIISQFYELFFTFGLCFNYMDDKLHFKSWVFDLFIVSRNVAMVIS